MPKILSALLAKIITCQCEISEAANASASKLIRKIKIPCPRRPQSSKTPADGGV